MSNFQVIKRRLNDKQHELEKEIKTAEKYLKSKIEFDFHIVYQSGDGFCIGSPLNGGSVALISHCLDVINEKGKLTKSDYLFLII